MPPNPGQRLAVVHGVLAAKYELGKLLAQMPVAGFLGHLKHRRSPDSLQILLAWEKFIIPAAAVYQALTRHQAGCCTLWPIIISFIFPTSSWEGNQDSSFEVRQRRLREVKHRA